MQNPAIASLAKLGKTWRQMALNVQDNERLHIGVIRL
jgi:hypothetical protein